MRHQLPNLPGNARRVRPGRLLWCGWLASIVVGLSTPGCAWFGRWGHRNEPALVRCDLPANPNAPQLVEHLNRNIEKMTSWRCTSVKITSRGPLGMPVSLNAILAVEADRNFRLMAHSVAGNEVDIGSNAERFWFWIRRGEPFVFTAQHAHLHIAQQRFPIPFQPDWLIEALGVTPLDANDLVVASNPATPMAVQLVRDRHSPQGRPMRQNTKVDLHFGVVTEHNLHDDQGRLIARAVMLQHRLDPVSGVVLPHQIELDWPPARVGLTIHLGDIDINPSLSPQVFEPPDIKGYPPMDLGQAAPLDRLEHEVDE